MEIFVSWSGERSKCFARAIKEWLKDVLHTAEPWMSEHDIDAGSRWHSTLVEALERSNFGVICVTKENQHAPWMIFEAGALSRQLKQSSVVPVLLGMSNTDLKPPLSHFQSVDANREGMFKLVQCLNNAMSPSLESDRLHRCFDRCWPELETAINTACNIPLKASQEPIRSDREILNELLEMMRGLSQTQSPLFAASGAIDGCVFVDLHPICREEGRVVRISIDEKTSVADFLDQVYYAINRFGEIPEYTYGELWMLKDTKTDRLFDKMGKRYCETLGRERDERKLSRVGIKPDSRLTAYPLSKKHEE